MSYTIKLDENQRCDLITACEFAVKWLTHLNPDNPNIKKYQELKEFFDYK